MQLFFSALSELEHFTHRLKTLPKDNTCEYCAQNDQWVSHGYVYKQRSIKQREVVGKRILCSNRFANNGCGRTRQLYVHDVVPGRRYSLRALVAFILHLLGGLTVTRAWQLATGAHTDARHAWRWLKDVFARLGHVRTLLARQARRECLAFALPRHRCRRLQILLPTLQQLARTCPLPSIQLYWQQAFF